MLRRPAAASRRGAVIVEFAILLPLVLVPVLFGIWEVGRMVDVQQLVANAAREGARLAAVGLQIDPATGQTTYVYAQPQAVAGGGSGPPDVQTTVRNYLARAGYPASKLSNITVTYTNLTNSSRTDPWNAKKLDHFTVTVTIPYADLSWGAYLIATNPTTQVTASADWYSMLDDDFSVSNTVPYNQ